MGYRMRPGKEETRIGFVGGTVGQRGRKKMDRTRL